LDVPLVLDLRIGDPAERAAEIHAEPVAIDAVVPVDGQARVLERHPPGDEPELAEPVELAGGLWIHVVQWVEVVDLCRHLGPERRRIEAVDSLHRRGAAVDARPERVPTRADRAAHADAGDPDATPHIAFFAFRDPPDRARAPAGAAAADAAPAGAEA